MHVYRDTNTHKIESCTWMRTVTIVHIIIMNDMEPALYVYMRTKLISVFLYFSQ